MYPTEKKLEQKHSKAWNAAGKRPASEKAGAMK
jgi:hypothetical protein